MVVAWVVLGVVMLGVELHHLAFYALFGAIGAFAAAAVAALAPGWIIAQLAVAVAVAVAGVVVARPFVSRAIAHRNDGEVARGVHGGLIGQEVLTLDAVGGVHRPGHIRLAGERWLAVNGDDGEIPFGTRVVVTAVTGTTLTVWPLDHLPLAEFPEAEFPEAEFPEAEFPEFGQLPSLDNHPAPDGAEGTPA